MTAIKLLVPDLPRAEALLPYLRRIDAARWYTNFGPLTDADLRRVFDALRRVIAGGD